MFRTDAVALVHRGTAARHRARQEVVDPRRPSDGRLHYTGMFEESRQAHRGRGRRRRARSPIPPCSPTRLTRPQEPAGLSPGDPSSSSADRRVRALHGTAARFDPVGTRRGIRRRAASVSTIVTGFERWYECSSVSSEAEASGSAVRRAVQHAGARFLDGDLEEAEHCANPRALEFGRQREDVDGRARPPDVPHSPRAGPARRACAGGADDPAAQSRGAMWRPGLVLLLAEIGMRDEARELRTSMVRDRLRPGTARHLVPRVVVPARRGRVPPRRRRRSRRRSCRRCRHGPASV